MIRRFMAKRKPWRAAGPLGVIAVGLVVAQVVLAGRLSPTSISDTTHEVGDTVNFDASELSSDPDGDIALYEQDFDYDGSFNAEHPARPRHNVWLTRADIGSAPGHRYRRRRWLGSRVHKGAAHQRGRHAASQPGPGRDRVHRHGQPGRDG